MAFEPGGRADKLGNRFEGRWVAKQLLNLLNETINSVTIESVGDDEKGVDLWIELKDGIRQAQQCKARNASQESWSISDLKNRGVLEKLSFQLERDARYEFILVSGVSATQLRDICDSARNSNGNSEDFYIYQIQNIGKDREKIFHNFCSALNLNHENEKDRAKAYDYIRRTRVELYPDNENTWSDLLTMAGFLLTGNPEMVVATLLTYAENEDRLGAPIYADELWEYLNNKGVYPKQLVHDERITLAINSLQHEFFDSIHPRLINGDLINREETDHCVRNLETNGLIVIHGEAGLGKSGVLYELSCSLKSKNIPFLPIRLDSRIPENTASHFGQNMGIPDSPINCLAALAGDRFCVLIIDQLDAIRWTSVHSANALDVCKEMIRQALSLRRQGKNISVILSCRTYDLNNDPQIKNWLNEKQMPRWVKIEVPPLSQSILQQIIGEHYKDMTGRQIKILSNPQNLSMWIEIYNQKGELPPFRSATELMKRFWEFRREQLESSGINTEEINRIIYTLVDWLESNGKISAPSRILSSCSRVALDRFNSLGIILEQHNRVKFYHQAYLDFLIADRLVSEIENGDCILNWLGPKEKQTLFRRGQLQQALAMLAEESLDNFLSQIKEIVLADGIRFHLKHLVLEIIGQMDNIHEGIAELCMDLLDNDYWKPHVLGTVYYGHLPFIEMLNKKGIIDKWLNSSDNKDIDQALWLLGSVSEKSPDLVAKVLSPFIDKGDNWGRRIIQAFCWQVSDDSDAMFSMRLQLARRRILTDLIDWHDLCEEHPFRAIQMIEAVISTWSLDEKGNLLPNESSRIEQLYNRDLEALIIAAEQYSEETWDMLIPHVERLTLFEVSLNDFYYDRRIKNWQKEKISNGTLKFERGLVEMLIRVGQKLVKENVELLIDKIGKLNYNNSLVLQKIIIEVYAKLPEKYSDTGIKWLLEDFTRLHLGDGINEHEWMPAVRLVRALSPYCSEELFEKLEQGLYYYHSAEEKERARNYLIQRDVNYFDYYWGKTQYLLLPALSPDRISKKAAELIKVVERKFSGYPTWYFLRIGPSWGGVIGSKLDKNLDKISDKSWINIIKNKKIQVNSHGLWQQVKEDYAVESSIRQFSRSLERIAKRFPERFGQLALYFPEKTHPQYISAILNAMTLVQPDTEVPKEERASWEPATIETVLAVWEKFCQLEQREVAISFCRLIRNRAAEQWPDKAIEKLLDLAKNHPDLEPGKLNIDCDKSAEEATIDTLFQNTINCVRGVAAEAIGELLWCHPEWLKKLKRGIKMQVKDPHQVVRMAAIYSLLPVLNIDSVQAVIWFCEAASEDERISASPRAINFFNYAIRNFTEQLKPLIRDMVYSQYEDVSNMGAQAVAAYNLIYGIFDDEFTDCINGSVSQRKGVAEIAADFIKKEKYAPRCREILLRIFNDQDQDVRNVASHMFHDNFFEAPENIDLAKNFIKSRAFADDHLLFHYLKKHKESLIPLNEIILEICQTLSTTLLEETRDIQTRMGYAINDVSTLLLRLYEQAQESRPEIACQCLDAWDILFEKRVGNTKRLINEIEK